MKLTLYVQPINFTEFLVGEKAVFIASLHFRGGYSIPIIVTKKDYVFEAGPHADSPLRVHRYQKHTTGPC